MNPNDLPTCIGHYGTKEACENCKFGRICKNVIAKDRLAEVIEKVDKIEVMLHE